MWKILAAARSMLRYDLAVSGADGDGARARSDVAALTYNQGDVEATPGHPGLAGPPGRPATANRVLGLDVRSPTLGLDARSRRTMTAALTDKTTTALTNLQRSSLPWSCSRRHPVGDSAQDRERSPRTPKWTPQPSSGRRRALCISITVLESGDPRRRGWGLGEDR